MEADLKRGGQRVITLFVYLNELLPEDGGATDFPTLNLRMVPKKNSAVYWYPKSPFNLLFIA